MKYQYKTKPYEHQREALRRQANKEFFALPMDMGTGKALPVSEPVLTPGGFVRIDSLHVGDTVIGCNGLPCRVTGVFPQEGTEVWRVDFKDGGYVRCSPDHLWAVHSDNERANGKPYKVRTTRELVVRGILNQATKGYQWSVPTVAPVQFTEKQFPVDPYLLGVILGDGSIDSYGSVHLCTDTEILTQWVGTDYGHPSPGIGQRYLTSFKEEMSCLGLLGRRSWEKEVPPDYLLGSISQRLALLQGLLDTDGTANHTGGAVFTSTAEKLCDSVVWLAQSLGGIASKKGPYHPRHQRGVGRPAWDINVRLPSNMLPFRLARKVAAFVPATKYFPLRKIKAVYPIENEPTLCISVDAPDKLFITRSFIPTHNTKIILDTAAFLYEQGQINALVVVAPNGVHAQWVNSQVPVHLPDRIARRCAVWYAKSSAKVAQKKAWAHARRADPVFEWLTILAFNYEAMTTETGKKELWWVLDHSRALLVLDESHRAKSPNAVTTKALMAASRRAPYRRILSGTPFDNSPLDAYAQFQFLSPNILGVGSFASFKARYSVIDNKCSRCHHSVGNPIPEYCPNSRCGALLRQPFNYQATAQAGGVDVYPNILSYRNLDELRDKIAPYLYRVRKADCLDLPPKVYETRPVSMSTEQRRLYNEILEDGAAFLRSAGYVSQHGTEQDLWDLWLDPTVDKVVAKGALANMLRRRQVLGGFIEEGGVMRWIDPRPPRLSALLDVLEDIDGKVLIWAAFRPEVQLIQDLLDPIDPGTGERAGTVAVYYGGTDVQTRIENKERFIHNPACRYFVGTAAAGGTGVDGLTVASTVIYYSNGLKAGDRWQSEDRAHRIGQSNSVTIIDLVCEDTLDQVILDAFIFKRNTAEYLLGDLNAVSA